MIKITFLSFALYLISPAQAAMSLKEAFEASRANMESIKRVSTLHKAADERRLQARAGLLPTISAVGNYTRIDPPDQSGINRVFLLERQHSAAIRLQQPLLRGGVVSGYQLAKDEVLLAQFQKNATEINLYQLVISAYYRYFQVQLDVKNLQELLKFSQGRVKEIRGRTNVGRSRRGELVQAEAQLLTAQSQLEQGDINYIQAKETLEFYTGIPNIELAPLTMIPRELPGLSSYMDKLRLRPDIMASSQQLRIAERRIEFSKGGHYPQLDLVGNYYLDRTGALETSDWDAALVVNIPLYQGGVVQSRIKESALQKNAVALDHRQRLRTAETDLSVLYQNYKLMHSQLDSLKQAVAKAEEAYRLSTKDYGYGQVTNLDVLQSLNIFVETKRTYDAMLASAHMTYKNIEASAGVLP